MRVRISRALSHLREWSGVMALLLVLTGGVAYAADTIGSVDIIDESILSQDLKDNEVKQSDLAANAVQTGKIANNQVFAEDVRDDTLAGGGLGAADLSPASVGTSEVVNNSLTRDDLGESSVGAEELQGARIFDSRDGAINDPVGGGASEVTLLTPTFYEVIARCLENPAGTVKANIVVKSVGPTATTSAVDSTAPNGVNNATSLAHEAEATLVSVGPTTVTTWQTGQYAVTGFPTGTPAITLGFNGNVAAATKLGASTTDCRFQATALGGGISPE